MSEDRYVRPWEVREYKTSAAFTDGINGYIVNGYGLHSWKIVPLGSIVAVFVKLQNVPEKQQGIRAR